MQPSVMVFGTHFTYLFILISRNVNVPAVARVGLWSWGSQDHVSDKSIVELASLGGMPSEQRSWLHWLSETSKLGIYLCSKECLDSSLIVKPEGFKPKYEPCRAVWGERYMNMDHFPIWSGCQQLSIKYFRMKLMLWFFCECKMQTIRSWFIVALLNKLETNAGIKCRMWLKFSSSAKNKFQS